MSYGLSLTCSCCNHSEQAGVTYNHHQLLLERFDADQGIRWLYGKTGAETLPRLEAVAGELGTDGEGERDYWAPTEGNLRHALLRLAELARAHPQSVWSGD